MTRNLSIGMTGQDVAAVQRLLNYHLPLPRFAPLVPDGIFGPKTRRRVIDFQTLNKSYLSKMPVKEEDGVERKDLAIDGIVGPNTGRVLLDVRTVDIARQSKFAPSTERRRNSPFPAAPGTRSSAPQPFALQTVGDPPAPSPPAPTPTPPTPAPPAPAPPKVIRFVTLQAGTQAQFAPWVFSPFVLTGQFTVLARNDGKPDLLLTAGGQFASNLGDLNGRWTGQVFGQVGLGNLNLALGPVDFVNPSVQFMLQKNQGQPVSIGIAAANQVNLSLKKMKIDGIEQDRFVVFFNLQEVVGVGLDNGKCSAPATQGMIGLGWTVF